MGLLNWRFQGRINSNLAARGASSKALGGEYVAGGSSESQMKQVLDAMPVGSSLGAYPGGTYPGGGGLAGTWFNSEVRS